MIFFLYFIMFLSIRMKLDIVTAWFGERDGRLGWNSTPQACRPKCRCRLEIHRKEQLAKLRFLFTD